MTSELETKLIKFYKGLMIIQIFLLLLVMISSLSIIDEYYSLKDMQFFNMFNYQFIFLGLIFIIIRIIEYINVRKGTIGTVLIDFIIIFLLPSYLFEEPSLIFDGQDLILKTSLALVAISSLLISVIKIAAGRATSTDKPKNYITVTKDTIISIKLALYLNIVEIINLFIVIVCSLYYVSNIQSSQYENVVEEIILSMGSALMFFMVAILSIIVIFYKIFVIRNKEKVIKQCNNEGSIEEKTLKRLSSKQINIIIILAYAFVGFFKFIETDFISFIPIALLMVLEFMEIKNSRSIHI